MQQSTSVRVEGLHALYPPLTWLQQSTSVRVVAMARGKVGLRARVAVRVTRTAEARVGNGVNRGRGSAVADWGRPTRGSPKTLLEH